MHNGIKLIESTEPSASHMKDSLLDRENQDDSVTEFDIRSNEHSLTSYNYESMEHRGKIICLDLSSRLRLIHTGISIKMTGLDLVYLEQQTASCKKLITNRSACIGESSTTLLQGDTIVIPYSDSSIHSVDDKHTVCDSDWFCLTGNISLDIPTKLFVKNHPRNIVDLMTQQSATEICTSQRRVCGGSSNVLREEETVTVQETADRTNSKLFVSFDGIDHYSRAVDFPAELRRFISQRQGDQIQA